MMDGGCHLPLGVHCQYDVNNNYHVYAAYSDSLESPLRMAQVSSSTTDGLAQQVFDQLQS